jgi:hypothetical protein
MLPDLWTAQTDAPTTRSLEIASRFPQHPQPKPKVSFQQRTRHNLPVHQNGAAPPTTEEVLVARHQASDRTHRARPSASRHISVEDARFVADSP